MKLKVNELDAICRNMEPNEYLRGCIGSALCKRLYDSANVDKYQEECELLNDASFYNCPSEDDIFLCLDYLEENGFSDDELELDVL